MPENGFLLLSDITGFTAYLTQSELDHAHGILSDLLRAIIAETKPPLVLSKLEGDAVFSYAADKTYTQSQSLLEIVERTYIAFRKTRRQIKLDTTCTCNACSNIPGLDLKFFVHHGEYMLQEFGTNVELLGSDVNLVHRLMKNHVTDHTGLGAYAMYTEAAIKAMNAEEVAAGMTPHPESYEHLGEVNTFITNMHDVWKRETESTRVLVEEEDMLYELSNTVPYPRALVWDIITRPDSRNVIYGADAQSVTDLMDGRIGTGSLFHCAHGEDTVTHRILDWKPFDYYTFDEAPMPDVLVRASFLLEEVPGGDTKVTFRYGKPRTPEEMMDMVLHFYDGEVREGIKASLARTETLLEEAIAAGEITPADSAEVSETVIDEAVKGMLKQEQA